jgi:rSAM/selenodomain-associated transferase 2
MTKRPSLAVIIPALNAAATLNACLGALRAYPHDFAIVVVDGGSSDATPQIAQQSGAMLITAARGRGQQLAAGATAATSDWLLFVHADTLLAPSWANEVSAFITDTAHIHTAAVFTLALDDARASARWVEWISATRTRLLALPYGDQALLVSRALYDSIGGFRPIAIMEDVDIVRRLGRARIHTFKSQAITSAERYRRHGFFWRPLRNLCCLTLWFLGVPPSFIARIYDR